MSYAQYPIRTIADFATIPEDRIEACLVDFAAWLRVSRKAQEINRLATIALGSTTTLDTEGFTWVDDGIVGIGSVDIVSDGQKIANWPMGKP